MMEPSFINLVVVIKVENTKVISAIDVIKLFFFESKVVIIVASNRNSTKYFIMLGSFFPANYF